MKVRLGDICEIQYGYAFNSTLFTNDDQFPPLIRIRDVKRGYSETFYSGEYDTNYVVHAGDLLVGMDGEFNIARWRSRDALLNQRVCKITICQEVDEEYLRFALSKALKKIEARTSFVTVKHLSAKELNALEIESPSLEKQKEISNTLVRIETIICLYQQQLSKLDELIKSRFMEMFGEHKFELTQLDNICNFIDYRGKTPEKSSFGIPLITAKNVKNNAFSIYPVEYIPEENYRKIMTRGIPNINDVLFTTEAPLGHVCRIPNLYPIFCIGQRIITLQPNKDKLNSEYLEYALLTNAFKSQLTKHTSGSTAKGIKSKLLKKLTILLPPLPLQQQFAAFVEKVDKSKLAVKQSLEKLETLKKSLMQQYFG